MIRTAVFLISVLTIADGGQLSVLFTSPAVQFKATNDVLPESHVTEILQSAFGLQSQEIEWKGLVAGEFFDRPQALLFFTLSGISGELLNLTNSYLYDTLEDDPEGLNLHPLVENLDDLSRDEKQVLFIELFVDKRHRVHLGRGGRELGRVVDLQLPVSSARLYIELHAIRRVISTVRDRYPILTRDTPHVFHFQVSGLEHIVDKHGAHSQQMYKALTSLRDTVAQTMQALRELYNDDVMMLMLYQSASRQPESSSASRRKLQGTTPANDLIADLNLAPEFTWMYPVLFNISLWFMVVFSVTMFGVSWCIWFTDPGRDGVIYRMTHMKQA